MTNGVVKAASKPVVIEAFLWEGGPANSTPIINWILENDGTAHWDEAHYVNEKFFPEGIHIKTLEGTMRADPGDWIIRGTRGEFYPCKPDVFAVKYEVLDEPDGAS